MYHRSSPIAVSAFLISLSFGTQAAPLGLQFQVGQHSIDPAVAEREGIEESGFSLGMDVYTVWSNHLRVGGGFFSLFMGDNEEYSVMVEDQSGNVSEADSSSAVGSFYAEAGLTGKPLDWLTADLMLGYGASVSSRSISNCMDCPSEELDVPVGGYVKTRLGYVLHENSGSFSSVGLEYTHFLGESGMENGLMLSLGLLVDL